MSADELRGEGEVGEDTHRQVHPAAAIAWARLRRAGVLEAAPGMRDRLEAIAGDAHATATGDFSPLISSLIKAFGRLCPRLPAVSRRLSQPRAGDAFV